MEKVLIFAGTSEGRILAEYAGKQNMEVHVCVATGYGEEVLQKNPGLVVHQGRLNLLEMEELLRSEAWLDVVDATHPYAVLVSQNIVRACENAGIEYLRLLRKNSDMEEENDGNTAIFVESKEEAAEYLNSVKGNILFTTGSKELTEYVNLIKNPERIFARVLASSESIEVCRSMGLTGKQIIGMQGPFTAELNAAMLKQIDACYLVTKDTGENGGFPEKIQGAGMAGAKVVVIRRPSAEKGFTLEELSSRWNLPYLKTEREITLAGMGMGRLDGLTLEVKRALRNADVIIGAGRLLTTLKAFEKPMVSMYRPEEIQAFLKEHEEYGNILIALSGDVGFYSGAKKLLEVLQGNEYRIRLLCGISSAAYFCARLKIPWDDVTLTSIHGREQNVIGAVKRNEKVFSLAGGSEGIRKLSEDLISYQLGYVKMFVGYQLSYPEEEIISGPPEQFLHYEKEGLSVAIIINEKAGRAMVTHGLRDEDFLRGKAPMTKEEVRSISLSKLALTKEAIVYDVGAGTGSIAIECALQAIQGKVYAIEKKEEALELLRKNKYNQGAANLKIIAGTAPEALTGLPDPTHVFIGGSSGNLAQIVETVLGKNPRVRVVVTAIAMETVSEIMEIIKEKSFSYVDMVQVSIGKARELKNYHMMMGQNPVYIVTLQNF